MRMVAGRPSAARSSATSSQYLRRSPRATARQRRRCASARAFIRITSRCVRTRTQDMSRPVRSHERTRDYRSRIINSGQVSPTGFSNHQLRTGLSDRFLPRPLPGTGLSRGRKPATGSYRVPLSRWPTREPSFRREEFDVNPNDYAGIQAALRGNLSGCRPVQASGLNKLGLREAEQ